MDRLRMAVMVLAVFLFAGPFIAMAAAQRVVLYTSVDEPYARALMRRFEKQTGLGVTLVTDAEANKTAGLAQRLEAEKANPQADVYWGNEIFHTINLAQRGCFAPYKSAAAADIPARWHGQDELYTCVGLRARVLAVSTRPENRELISKIKGLEDLADPALKGKVGVCHPGFGTASGHFAAMYVAMGAGRYERFLQALRANDIKLLGGNAAVVEHVGAGSLVAGPTDNDDVANGMKEGLRVESVVPDQAETGLGTLLIPTTVAMVSNGPNPDAARKLIDFILDPSVEKELIEGHFLAYSVRSAEQQVKAMEVDYLEAARQMRPAVELALRILQGR